MSKILVTGASGFIGSTLVKRLVAQGHDVACLAREPARLKDLAKLPIAIHQGDVTDAEAVTRAVRGVERVFHLAGLIKALSAAELRRVNQEGTRHVAAACAGETTPPTLVIVSSLSAAGPSHGETPLREHEPAHPVSNYGKSKRAGEIAAAEWAGRAPISVVRPPVVFGEGDPAFVPVFRSIARQGIHLAAGIGRFRHSLIHVDDLCAALSLVAERGARLPADTNAPARGVGVYYVAHDESPKYSDFGRLIGEAFGRRKVWVFGPPGPLLIWTAAAWVELGAKLRRKPEVFGLDKVRDARAGNWLCSDEKLRRETNFAPAANLAARIRQTAEWYQSAGWV